VEGSGGHFGDSEPFAVSSSPATAAERPEFEGANVCRVAALSTILGGDRRAIRDAAPEMEELGIPGRLISSDRTWQDVDPLESFSGLQDPLSDAGDRERVSRWEMIGETVEPQAAVAFLVTVLGSHLERESAAAAAALWRQIGTLDPRRWARRGPGWFRVWERLYDLGERDWPEPGWWGLPWSVQDAPDLERDEIDRADAAWDPAQWTDIFQRAMSRLGDPYGDVFVVGVLVRWRLGRALRSPDPVTRSLAMAAFQAPDPDGEVNVAPPDAGPATPPGALVVSTMIHGTWGWKGDWWRPRGDFHEYILRNHRSNLYSRGAKFSWSGAYRDVHREVASSDFLEWAYDVAPNGLQTVFAHSYGGEVAARAVVRGARINELVLLSAPVTNHVEAATRCDLRVVDVRLRFDPVLALARSRQRIPDRPNVTAVLLQQWRLDHGATHREDIWRQEEVAPRGHL
jgi:hypothetical protein